MKAAIYCRLSEEDKNKISAADDSESIYNQKLMLKQYAENNGWQIYDIYSDDDYTGSDRNRPEFNRLISDAEKHKFQIVLCKTQSRFTREMELVEKYIHGLFPLWGIRFISIVDNADTDIKGNKKSRQINGLVNEWYLEDMSENIKSVLTNKRMNGLHIGSFALYGYKKDPAKKGHLIIDEEAAAIVREIFILFSEGYGKTAIARILNGRGVPNPTEYKRIHGMTYKQAKNSTLWRYSSISNILHNEIYIGNMVQGKYESVSYKSKANRPRPRSQWYVVQNTHQPIIDIALWDKVQLLLDSRSKPFSDGKTGLFARKVLCAHCGYTMRSGKTKGYRYLKCPNKHVSENACIGSYINTDKLEYALISELKKFINLCENIYDIDKYINWNTHLEDNKKCLLQKISEYTSSINYISNAIKNAYLDKIKGIITEDEYLLFSNEFKSDKMRYEDELNKINSEIAQLDVKLQDHSDHLRLIDRYLNIEQLNKTIIDVFIDHIEISKRNKSTNIVDINIFWNF